MSMPRYSKNHLFLAACVGAALMYGALNLVEKKNTQSDRVQPEKITVPDSTQPPAIIDTAITQTVDIEQLRKDLSTRFIGDPRTLGEKLRDFVAEKTLPQTIAIACKVIFDLAENPDALSNQELHALYHNQTDAELTRVIAQVLSLRGDNSLIEAYLSAIQTALPSNNLAAQRKALQALAKTHYAGAAKVIAPLLEDDDTSLKLDALLALRAAGNESHIPLLEKLINDADQSVSWLAKDAINQLQYLSTKARTRLTAADIAAELPPLTNQ